MVNYYKEEIELNGDICPNCSELGFDIKIRKCELCDYNISHNTLSVVGNMKDDTEEIIEENIMTPEEQKEERDYIRESRGKERRNY